MDHSHTRAVALAGHVMASVRYPSADRCLSLQLAAPFVVQPALGGLLPAQAPPWPA